MILPTNGSGFFYEICGHIFEYAKEVMLVGNTDLKSILDKIGFGAATEMGVFVLDKVPEVSLEPKTIWIPIFASSALIVAAAKLSISNNYFPSGSLNIKLPTLLLLLLRSPQINFYASFNSWFQ